MPIDIAKEKIEITMEELLHQLNMAAQNGFIAGQYQERELVADWMLKLSKYSCLKPNWEQISADIRKGLDKLNEK
jgi:hypothetical protein